MLSFTEPVALPPLMEFIQGQSIPLPPIFSSFFLEAPLVLWSLPKAWPGLIPHHRTTLSWEPQVSHLRAKNSFEICPEVHVLPLPCSVLLWGEKTALQYEINWNDNEREQAAAHPRPPTPASQLLSKLLVASSFPEPSVTVGAQALAEGWAAHASRCSEN